MAQKQLAINITVCQDGFEFYCVVLRQVSLILNSIISTSDNFVFHANVMVCNVPPSFPRKHRKDGHFFYLSLLLRIDGIK